MNGQLIQVIAADAPLRQESIHQRDKFRVAHRRQDMDHCMDYRLLLKRGG
jgi:hypothetical protein